MEIKKEDYKEFLTEDYLSLKDASAMLEITEEELRALIKRHQVPTHNVAGVFLRLKKKEIENLKNKWRIERDLFARDEQYFAHNTTVQKSGWLERLGDFWYFNDFYLLCSMLIAVLLYFIVSTQ